ncbi:MAG: TetR family transcriptional regulator [Aeromicrobium sp.]
MATRARLTQERSRQRREQLLDAAIALFAEGGSRGITHRAVAARAGLPPATTTYYFNSIDELIDEALSRHIEKWLSDLRHLTKTPADIDLSLDDASGLISAVFAVRSVEIVGVQLSIYLAAALNPDLRSKAAESLDALEALAAQVLGRVGVPEPAALAQSIVALIAGSALRRTSGRQSNDVEALILFRAIRALVTNSLMSDEEVQDTLRVLKPGTPV